MASFLDIPFQSLGNSYENNKDKKKGSIFNDIREAKKIYENIRKTIKYVRVVATTLNPGILMAVVLFIIIIFIFFFDTQNTSGLIGGGGSGDGGTGDSTQGGGTTVPSIPGFNIEIEGPETSANGVNLEYTVTISHNPNIAPPLASIEVYDSLPTGATLVSTTGVLKDSSTGPNIWSLSDPANQAGFQIIIRPNQTDTFFDYTVSARQIAGAGPIGGGSTPTEDNCNGKYDLSATPLGTNFGDPDCNFTKDGLYTMLKRLDPANADRWYYQIIPCESQYHPLAHNGAAVDPAGAWGMYQMGRGRNGPYDRGDVDWETQTSNAINYNALINGSFAYWACAR